MVNKYTSSDKIPDQEILEAFKGACSIRFSAGNFNHIKYRKISFGNLGWWLPFSRVLTILGITPQDLRPVFDHQPMSVRRKFFFGWGWFGLNKWQYKVVDVLVPETINTFDSLGSFPFDRERFQMLANIIKKPIEVLMEDGVARDQHEAFTVFPDL
jgi:hypothetical protein